LNTSEQLAKLPHLVTLTRINRPIGILLLLWPVMWALWLAANGMPTISILVIFIVGAVLTRSAGCAINDYADRHWDGKVKRTENRPLANGNLTPTDALITTAVLMLLAFVLVLFTNALTIKLSFVALILAVLYPYTKRVTHWPQVFLGLAFAWAVPMAFAAQLNSVPMTAWIVFAAAVTWTLAYDTLYAMVDRGWIFFASLCVAAFTVAKQLHDCRHRDREECFKAFLNNHRVGLIVFIGLASDYLFNQASL